MWNLEILPLGDDGSKAGYLPSVVSVEVVNEPDTKALSIPDNERDDA